MDATNLTLPIAFLAGLLSFASPCVLPLVPAYIGYLGGTTVMSDGDAGARRETARTFLHSLCFVLGFGLVFILLGASATLLGRFLFDFAILLQRVGGVLLVVFGMRLMAIDWDRKRWFVAAAVVGVATFVLDSGLIAQGRIVFGEYTITWLMESVMMGLVVLAGAGWSTVRQVILAVAAGILNFMASFDMLVPNLAASVLVTLAVIFLNRAEFFYAEKKIELKQTEQTGYLRSLLFGVVFAAGWTPCIGPILAGILLVASQLDTGRSAADGIHAGAGYPLPAGGSGLWPVVQMAAPHESVPGYYSDCEWGASGADGSLDLYRQPDLPIPV